MDPKSNESRRKTKTIPVEKDDEGSFEVEMFEELWFKNKKEGNVKPTLKFVVWNRHIGDSNTSGKDSEGLYYAEIERFEGWIANGLYLGRVPLLRYGSKQKVDGSYIQVSIEMKYSEETNVYSANLHRATSNTNRLNRRRTSGSIVEPPLAAPRTTNSDETKEGDNCQYLEGYNNEKSMFNGCDVLMKRVTDGREVHFEGAIGEYVVDEKGWNVSWKSSHNGSQPPHSVITEPPPRIITKDALLKHDVYKVYRSNKSNKDVLNTYQFFKKVERDDMYSRQSK